MKRKLWKLIFPAALLLILLALSLALAVPASAASYESYMTGVDSCLGFTYHSQAQTFTATSDHNVNAVNLMLCRDSGYTATITVSITATDSNGYPTWNKLTSGTLPASGIPTNADWVSIPMNNSYSLSNNTKYAIVVSGAYPSGSGYCNWYFDGDHSWDTDGTTYAGGSSFTWYDYNGVWGQYIGDFMFQIQDTSVIDTYSLTVTTNPPSIDSTTGAGTYSANATVSISAPEYVDITAGQSRYHFNGWTGIGVTFGNAALPSTTVTMPAGATTITANYVTQYKVHYAVAGNTLTITVPSDEWVNSGSGPIGSFPVQVTNTAGNVRDNFVSDNRPAVPPGITGPTTVTATYQTQYMVHYATTGAVLTVTVPADEWANSGAAATGAFPLQVVNNSGNTRCSYVSDNRPAVPTGVIAPITVTATYQTQYYVVLDLRRGFDSAKADGIGTVLKVNGSEFTCRDLPFSAWFSAGSSLNYEFTAVIDGAPGVKYGWVHNGGINYLTERASNIQVNAYTITQAMYLSYAVTVSPGSGQYSDNVSFTAQVRPYASSTSMFAYPTDVHFYVGAQDIGSVDLSPSADEVTTCGTLNAPLLETINGQLAAGTKVVTAKWNDQDSPVNPTTLLTITQKDSNLTIVSSGTLATGSVTVKAILLADGISPISGRTVNFAAGSANATGATDSTGTASATLSLPPGEYTLGASFAGDSYYQPGNAAAQTLYVYQATTFVIWGANGGGVAAGQGYVFCGAQWTKQVKAGDFQANSSFKGYADTVNISNKTWTAMTGNSSNPPAAISSYISVIVSTHIAKNGSTICGNIDQVVILKVDNPASYKPDQGSTGSGVLVAVVQ